MTSITDISQWVVEHPWKTAGILAVTYETYRLAKSLWIDPYLSPLSALPGPPKADNWLLGNIPTIYAQKPARAFEKWFEEYNSHTVVYRGGFSVRTCNTDRTLGLLTSIKLAGTNPYHERPRCHLAYFGQEL